MSTLKEFKAARGRMVAEKYNADLIVATLPENIFYYSGFFPMGMSHLYSTEGFLVYNPYTEKSAIVTSVSDVPTVLEQSYVDEIYGVGGFNFYMPLLGKDAFTDKLDRAIKTRYPSAVDAAIAACKSLAPDARTIILDESRIMVGNWKRFTDGMPGVNFIPGVEPFKEIRYIKHEEEVELLRRSANITEEAFFEAVKMIKPGVSEYDIAMAFNREVSARGAEPYFFVVTCDERAAYSDTCYLESQIVKPGSVLRFDMGCIYKHYRSDIARTVVVGRNEKAENAYAATLAGEAAAIAAIKPGITAGEVFEIAESVTQKNGLPHYKRHHTGHGIGMATYDAPSIVPGSTVPLEEGMTLCIETPYYEIGWGGVQVEDTIVVRKDGAEYLTKSSRELIFVEG